jgi:hypothetical protein
MSEQSIVKPGTPEFAGAVRSWAHYDNLVSTHTKQASNSRKIRDNYENVIIESLKKVGAENAVIQMSTGKIQIAAEKSLQHMSLGLFETLLHEYFKSNGGTHKDETDNIMKFIKSKRHVNITQKLKRVD